MRYKSNFLYKISKPQTHQQHTSIFVFVDTAETARFSRPSRVQLLAR